MRVSFTKGSGKYDRMSILRNGITEVVDCPKQRIIPHDMVHYAVESALHGRGFLGRVRDGEIASFQMGAEPESDGVERLVEVFQGDAWSGGNTSPDDMIELYRVTCLARGCPHLSVTPDDIIAVRHRISELDRQWQVLPVGASMTLEF